MYIKIRVKTKQKKEILREVSADHLEISVKEPAERNLANDRVLDLVREHFKVYNGGVVRIVSGHHSPSKIISLPDKIL
ncbi:MAG: DUF167 domain-containing protein [bacterium]